MIQRWQPTPVSPSERREALEHLERRFGLPLGLFEPFELFSPNGRELALVPRDLAAPELPPALWQGLILLRVNMADAKPTTAAAQIFGLHATRNVIALRRVDRARAFLGRQEIHPTSDELARVTGPGWVLVSHEEHILGVGYLRAGDQLVLESQYPKAWAF